MVSLTQWELIRPAYGLLALENSWVCFSKDQSHDGKYNAMQCKCFYLGNYKVGEHLTHSITWYDCKCLGKLKLENKRNDNYVVIQSSEVPYIKFIKLIGTFLVIDGRQHV